MVSDRSKVEVRIQSAALAEALRVFAGVTEEEFKEYGFSGFDDMESFSWIDVDEGSVVSFEITECDYSIGFRDWVPRTMRDVPVFFKRLAEVGFLGKSLVASCWPAIEGLPGECGEASIICQDLFCFCDAKPSCYTGVFKIEGGIEAFSESEDENDLYNEVLA